MRRSILAVLSLVLLLPFMYGGCGGGGGSNTPADYYFWDSLGSPGAGWGYRNAIAIDPSDNKPVVVFKDISTTPTPRPHVMKWSVGTSWTDMGFLTAQWGDMPSLVIDPSDNKPVVAFEDNINNGRAHVKKWSGGTSWTDLGFPSTGSVNGWWRPLSIALDPSDNKPLVAFGDDDNGGKIHVTKWSSGTSWTDFGLVSTGEGSYPSIAVDPSDNKPIVVFVDIANGEKAHAKKWSSGTSWTDLGFLSDGVSTETMMAIDPSDNKPIVAFVDWPGGLDAYVHVKKWSSGTSWIDLGNPSQAWSDSLSLAIDLSDNKPVVAFRDWANDPNILGPGNAVHVKKWSSGTSWIGLGYPSEGPSVPASMAFDPSDNKPVVLYADAWEGDANVYVAKHP